MSSDGLGKNLLGEPGMGAHKSCPSLVCQLRKGLQFCVVRLSLVIAVVTSPFHNRCTLRGVSLPILPVLGDNPRNSGP